MTPYDVLRQCLGFSEFRPGQLNAINHLLSGRNLLTVMPTGAGKSLIYQVAALLLPGATLVISPLLALMKDQVDGMVKRGLAATFINSSLDPLEANRRLHGLAHGKYKIVLVAPERLRNPGFNAALARVQLSLLVVDEAHCLSQWGHDFRPDYLHIAELRRAFKPALTLALTATATPGVQDEILQLLELPKAERLVTGFNRPNLFFEVIPARDARDKLRLVGPYLTGNCGPGIIYAGTRRDAEEVAEFVREGVGMNALHYHAGLDADARVHAQEAFLSGAVPIIVATNAFGMGIDCPDVRFVLHYSLPGSLEAYYQEAGRAGRDGLPARATLLYLNKDTALQEAFIENDSPTANDLKAVHEYLQRAPQTSLDNLEIATGLPETKARIAIELLEQARVLSLAAQVGTRSLHAEVGPLSEATLKNVTERIELRRRHRRALLHKMVSYAETGICRRRTILDYFGDDDQADAPLCCDNHVSRSFNTEPARVLSLDSSALIVLQVVRELNPSLGRSKIAKILKGSRARDISRFAKSRHYAALADRSRDDIEALIKRLVEEGYLVRVGEAYPVIKLTARGKEALGTGVGQPNRLQASSPVRGSRPAEPGGQLAHAIDGADPSGDIVAGFLSRAHPRSLPGPWLAGWALDFHSRFNGDVQERSPIGEQVFRFKYQGEQSLAASLAEEWARLLSGHPELPRPDAIVPIPPSQSRDFDPVAELACRLAELLQVPVAMGLLVKIRETRPQKEMSSLVQKQDNVAGAFAVQGDAKGKCLLLVDDLYDSGATLAEAARMLTRAGAAKIVVLTLTKTIHADS